MIIPAQHAVAFASRRHRRYDRPSAADVDGGHNPNHRRERTRSPVVKVPQIDVKGTFVASLIAALNTAMPGRLAASPNC
jgi:hypothetical protein